MTANVHPYRRVFPKAPTPLAELLQRIVVTAKYVSNAFLERAGGKYEQRTSFFLGLPCIDGGGAGGGDGGGGGGGGIADVVPVVAAKKTKKKTSKESR